MNRRALYLIASGFFVATSLFASTALGQSTVTYPDVSSQPSQNSSLWIPLRQYPSSVSEWPERGDGQLGGCATLGGDNQDVPRKSLPWLGLLSSPALMSAAGGDNSNGDNVALEGDCNNRYTDGGTADTATGVGVPGAWLRPTAYAGWTGVSYSESSAWNDASLTNGQPGLDSAKLNQSTARIWARGTADNSDHSASNSNGMGLFERAGYANFQPDVLPNGTVSLVSNGVSLFRNTFTLTTQQINNLSSAPLEIIADDFYAVYVNGVFVAGASTTTTPSYPDIASHLVAGDNVIAVQAIDKAVWVEGNPSNVTRAAGLQYRVAFQQGQTSSETCESYDPFSPFSPLIRTITLNKSGKPADYTTDPIEASTNTPTNGSENIGAWSGSSTSQSRTVTRTVTQTQNGTRERHYYEYYNTNPQTDVNSVTDILWAGEQTPYNDPQNGTVELDYTVHRDDYPYDSHQPRIYYEVRYQHRSIDQNGSRSRTKTQTRTDTRTRDNPDDEWNESIGTFSDGTYGSWSSWGGWSDTGLGRQEEANLWTDEQQQDADVMPPCLPRNFVATTETGANPLLEPDRELPTESSFTFTISVNFAAPTPLEGVGQLREASAVPITYTVISSVRRVNGTTDSQQSNTSTITVNAPNNNLVSANQESISRTRTGLSVPTNLQTGDRICWTVQLQDRGGTLRNNGTILQSLGQSQPNELCSLPVVNWPYIKVFGADIMSGGSMGTCTLSPNGDVRSRFRSGSPLAGSSSQYAIFAFRQVSGTYSAAFKPAGQIPSPIKGLTFANTGSTYGGDYSGDIAGYCLPDYQSFPEQTEQITGTQLVGRITVPNDPVNEIDYYHHPGSYTLNEDITIPNGAKKVVYIDGNLRINRNVRYATTWTQRSEVPMLILIADNIVIDGQVTNIDGIYVARNNGSGSIRTCHIANYSACQNELVVNGALVAEQIELLRTRGSLRDSIAGEGGTSSVGVCSLGTASVSGTFDMLSCAAEIIHFSPEIYLGSTNIRTPRDDFRLDSYVVLPPNL